jgi:hypothetical protein
MEVRFKNFVTIRGSYTQQGLSNHITFRPIKSGATVPLKVLHEGLRINRITPLLHFFYQQILYEEERNSLNVFSVIKILVWIRIGIHQKALDPDLDSMNMDPIHCYKARPSL